MKRFTTIALAVLMVLTVLLSVIPASAAEATSLEIRGTVEDTGAIGPISWNANNWAAFYYDINDPLTATETLAYADTVATNGPIGGVVTENIMDKAELTYTTGDVGVNYKVFNAKGAIAKIPGNQYGVLGWMAEKFVAIDGDSQKITKLILEQGADDKKTLRAGESWDLGNGYTLTPEQIDVDGNKVWLTLSKDGVVIEDEILNTQLTANHATFVAKADFAGKSDVIYFVTYVDAAFRGTATDLVQFKYTWLIDKTDIVDISTDDTFGNFKVTGATSNLITISNDNAITLTMDDKVNFMENMYFQVSKANKGSLGGFLFYPAKEVTTPGTYEVRGAVEDTGAIGPISWNANNWAAFYYDINDPLTATETLAYTDTVATNGPIGGVVTENIMDKAELTYTTGDVGVNYKVFNAKGAIAKIPGNQYGVLGWMAEKFVAIDGDSQKITKLILEQGADDKKTLRAGESWDLGNGYTLTPEQIDVDGNKVWLTLSKDGVVIEDEILNTQLTANHATFVAKADFAGKSDVIYFVTYVDAAFRGTATDLVQFKYTWLIDKTDIVDISTDDTFGNFKVTGATSNLITISNDNAITLTMDDKVNFMENMYFQVSKATKGSLGGFLFYPAKEVTIGGEVPVVDKPVVDKPAVDKPAVDEPAVDEPAVDKPAVDKPAVDETPVVKPPVEDADTEEPVEEEPGFEAIFAIAGLLAVAFLVRRNK